MGRHPGFTLTAEQKRNVARGMAAARERRFREQGLEPPPPKRGRTRRAAPEIPVIAPPAFAEPAVAPDMKRIERGSATLLSRLRSLERQLTTHIESAIAVRRQVVQLAQEEEV